MAESSVANNLTRAHGEAEIETLLFQAEAVCRLVEAATEPARASDLGDNTLMCAMHVTQQLISAAREAYERQRIAERRS